MPLLETAVSSSVKVTKALGAFCPWEDALVKAQKEQEIPASVSYTQVVVGEVLKSKAKPRPFLFFLLLLGLCAWVYLKVCN